jgi:hypothetical protein
LHYRSDTTGQSFILDQSIHSSVKPYIIKDDISNYFKESIVFGSETNNQVTKPNNYSLKIYPLSNISVGADNITGLNYDIGLGAGIDYGKGNFYITGKFLPQLTKGNYQIDSLINFNQVYPGGSQNRNNNMFFYSEILAAYRVNKFFTFMGGYGKNFFGEGYRSLLLSDNARANPFLKIETSFGSSKYVNLFQVWHDVYQPPNQSKKDGIKFSANHYISWNITKQFNLSIFETVVMQGKDSLSNRGFDLNYLNPVVFYRPVEYGTGSADNVLLGLNMSYKTLKKQTIYYQLILDEFLLSELKSDQKWWANKYGMQLGIKAQDFIINNLNVQAEFNFVRPFTYSHKHSAQNYGHLNASVAHPIGANFFEIIGLASYRKDKHTFTNKLTYSAYGIDTAAINYGQNIFHSYSDRDGNYGHSIMQGLKTNVLNNQLICEYPIVRSINLYFTAQYHYRFEINEYSVKHNHAFQIGLKSRIWNKYTDF